ncbi:steroid 17-alpha-hydroxylase/17,20 lyase isoform X1 [Nematostella vectensis]|uniref:steroid 17-alpha-hydroxylase/17,20 lyase isoform X1 n=1 Tax=Nematostella vectensis TaxID=45351 RepID=UPI0020770357|nr:steroid 17-alpha-hydroxylase/17,20 lyase isoform X1 [Nematostella vectensis]
MIAEVILLIVTLVLLHHLFHRYTEPSNLPPGPRPYPLIGNLPQVVGSFSSLHVKFTELAKAYGSVYTLYLNGQRSVVVGSAKALHEGLVERKDAIAGRPYSFSMEYGCKGCKNVGFADFSPLYLFKRRVVHSSLRQYYPQVEDNVNHQLDDVLTRIKALDGTAFDPHYLLSLVSLNLMSSITFGTNYTLDDPEFLRLVQMNDAFGQCFGAFNILDMFPFLLHFPIKASKLLKYLATDRYDFLMEKARKHEINYDGKTIRDLTDGFIKALSEAEKDGSEIHSLIDTDHVAMTMGDMVFAGSETSATTMRWMLAYLTVYPEVQARLHQQLDDVIGRDKNTIITLNDRDRLPYVEAVIAETLRVSPPGPFLLPHKATCDTTLDGYLIPKDTTVIFNLWKIQNDPAEWADPHVFNPARFLDEEGKFVNNKNLLPFSAGRRVCLGEKVAKMELFLMTSRLLRHLEFKPLSDGPLPSLEGTYGVVYYPMPYKIRALERL